MDLDRINIIPRVRTRWEAIDLGFIMAKSWYLPLYLSWFLPAVTLYLLLSIIFVEDNWIAIMLVWWMKPMLDKAPLFIASRRLFGDELSVREIVRALPGVYLRDALAWLTWRRFSLTRSFDMPVTVLEGLKGSPRSSRLGVLHIESSDAAAWLTFICVHLEMVITLGLFGLVFLLVPESVEFDPFGIVVQQDVLATFISNVITLIAMSLIAPFFAMAGFSLYLNRRIKLEAWDIEVRFRHMAERVNGSVARAVAMQTMVLAVCLSSVITPQASYAQQEIAYGKDSQEYSRQIIDEVLEGEDFHNEIVVTGWRFRDMEDEESLEEFPQWLIDLVVWLESLFDDVDVEADEDSSLSLAFLLEMLFWLAVFLISLYVLKRLNEAYHLIDFSSVRKNEAAPLPEVLFGLDVREGAIPDDLADRVQELWAAGRHREAVSMLYASTLSLLMHHFEFRFSESDTETECATIVQGRGDHELSRFMFAVTGLWQRVAYAHDVPADDVLRPICDDWSRIYDHE